MILKGNWNNYGTLCNKIMWCKYKYLILELYSEILPNITKFRNCL